MQDKIILKRNDLRVLNGGFKKWNLIKESISNFLSNSPNKFIDGYI